MGWDLFYKGSEGFCSGERFCCIFVCSNCYIMGYVAAKRKQPIYSTSCKRSCVTRLILLSIYMPYYNFGHSLHISYRFNFIHFKLGGVGSSFSIVCFFVLCWMVIKIRLGPSCLIMSSFDSIGYFY